MHLNGRAGVGAVLMAVGRALPLVSFLPHWSSVLLGHCLDGGVGVVWPNLGIKTCVTGFRWEISPMVQTINNSNQLENYKLIFPHL